LRELRPLEFTSLPMMKLRSSAGEVLDRVSRDGESFVIHRSGQQLACLVPVSMFLPDVDNKRLRKDLKNFKSLEIDYSMTITPDKEICFKLTQDDFLVSILMPHGYHHSY